MQNPFEFVDKKTNETLKNSLGYQQLVTTLTAVGRKVSHQKFYEIPFADYVPVVIGNGSYKRYIINWRTFVKSEGFEAGIISNAGNNSQPRLVDAAYDELQQKIISWGKAMSYNVFELEEAMQANTLFSLIEARELARKKEWDLGLQKVAFLGAAGQTGLLNNGLVHEDTSSLGGFIKNLSADDFNTFVGKIYELYRANCVRTAKPTHFIIPEVDFNGLVNYPSATFPLKTKLQLLEESFKTITANQGFKILPNAYGNKDIFGSKNLYVLLNYDETSVKMDIPIDYTSTQIGTVDGFTWQNVAFGQFTGVISLREKEMLYLSHTA
jgi:hypothetical protein